MMTLEKTIKSGDRIKLHYTITLANEDFVADSTREGEPLLITIGEGDMIPGLEKCLIGLRVGDNKQFDVPCLEAYGPADMDSIHTIARSDFPDKMELEPGLVVGFETPSGEEVAGTIQELSENKVIMDFAHPLAGHDLIFDVEIIDVTD